MENDWYLYAHKRFDKNEIFYIGIGKKKNYGRAYEFNEQKRNNIWNKIFNKTNIEVLILFDNISKEIAAQKEKELIKLYGRMDLNEGSLCNMTDGGDGILNCKRSDITKSKLSLQKIGDKNPMYGKKQSDETKNKRNKSLTGQVRNLETKIKQSLSTIKSGQAKEVDVYIYLTNEYIGRYYAISEACRQLGFIHLNGKACQVAKGNRNHVKGYSFRYVE
jgi:hypothetical protein